uniref:D-aminoacyl-tRNA deacylase n=1 Tax=Meloidogyne floridensis TaxID=298350 RepID=A0A915P3X4_9BILA
MSCDNDSIIEHLVNSVLESVFVGEIFRIHRDLTINKLIGFKEWGEEEDCDSINEGKQSTRKSSISVSLRNPRNIECRCFVCSRVRRRVNIVPTYEASTSSNVPCRTTRSSTLRSATKTTTNNFHEKAIIQRVCKASVVVEQETISSIGRGICVLIGISREDGDEDIEYMVRKILNLRIFEDPENGKRWDKSVVDLGLEVLSVSQFTLHALIKGNKLDFHRSMNPEDAPQFYLKYLEKLKSKYIPEKIKDGKFGAFMSVHIENDGPVTISLDSKERE